MWLWRKVIWSLIRHRDIFRELSKQMAFTVRCLCSIQCQEQQTLAVVFTIFGDISLQLNPGHQPNETLKSPSQIPRDATSPARLAAWHKPDRLRKLEDATFLRRTIAPPEWAAGGSQPGANSEDRPVAPVLFPEKKTSPVSVTTEWTRLQMTLCHGYISYTPKALGI